MNIKKLINSKLVHSGLWLFVLQIFNTVIPLITVPYVTRLLTPAGYGVFSGALNWIVYLQVVVEYGFNLYGSRQAAISNDRQALNCLYNTILSARFLLLLISSILLSILVAVMGKTWENILCLGILFLIVVGSSVQATWLFQGCQDMKVITLINVISRLISVILIFLQVRQKSHLYLYCLLYAVTYIISGVASAVIARHKYQLVFHFASVSAVAKALKEGFPLFLSAAISSFFSGFSTTLLTIFSTPVAVGVFSAIHKIPMVINMMFTPIGQAIYPHVSQLHAQDACKASRFIRNMLLLCILVFGLMCGVLMICNKFITNLLFGPEYGPYSRIIIPFALQSLFGIINNFLGIQKLVAAGYQSVYSRAFTIAMSFLVAVDVALVRLVEEPNLIWCFACATWLAEMLLTVLLVAGHRKTKE